MTEFVEGAPRDTAREESPPAQKAQSTDRSRRRFLGFVAGGVAAAAASGWAGSRLLRGRRVVPAAASTARGAPSPGTVVRVTHPRVVSSNRRVDAGMALDMVDAALARLTGQSERAAAWSSLFSPDDVVAIKVNCLAPPPLSTHPEIVQAIITGLRDAEVPDGNIIIYDRLTHELERAGFTPNTGRGVRCFGSEATGYDSYPSEAGVVGSCLSRIVSELCTAIINVPLVKDHDVAGVSIALKNHFGSINNPNKQHENQCCPQVADVNLFDPIRSKQRLIIADALIVTYDGGPAYKPNTSAQYNGILAATDPVALDAVGWDLIEGLRRRAELPTLAEEGREPKYISVAADEDHHLGIADLARIHGVDLDLGGEAA
ncbi:MAG: DUF362 domain-containing protein [Armatimonadota bacterium]|nr:MAG: DUF362 domain-containing protein [Armatimonadota bacterium]